MSVVDRGTDWLLDRYIFAANKISKYRTRRKAPPYIAAELEQYGLDFDELIGRFDEKQLQHLAVAIPWVYANIGRIAKEVSSTDLHVFEGKSREKNFDHEVEHLIMRPNEFFSGVMLLQYTIWAMMLDRQGAYWFLMPDTRRKSKIIEVWPVQMNRIEPIRHKTKFISGYKYTPRNQRKAITIDPRYIVRFFFPNPFSLFESLTPLTAARSGISLYEKIIESQTSLHGQGRGVPLSIVSVDENVSDADFDTIREDIKNEWASGSRLTIARAGTIDVESVSISNRDMETIATQELNRDEIDSVFMDIAWHGEMGEGERKEINRQIKEHVIFPLHKLLAGQIDIQLIDRFYEESLTVGFDDVRKTDRAMFVQEFNITGRAKTFNEARKELNLPEYDHELLPDLGELPLQLATNPSFVSSLYDLAPVKDTGELPPEPGNLPDSRDPEAEVNQEARGGDRGEEIDDVKGVDMESIVEQAQREELKKYRKVCRRALERNGTLPADITFDTDIIPPDMMLDIREKLGKIASDEGIREVFDEFIP